MGCGGGSRSHSDSNASQRIETFGCAIKFQKFSFGIVILHDTNIGPQTVTRPSLYPTSHKVSEQERLLLAKQKLCQMLIATLWATLT